MWPITEEEIKTVTAILKKLSPGFLPFDIFHEVTRLVALPIIELVPFREKNGQIEVLLLPREDDDPIFAGQLHTPGVVLRATDNPVGIQSAFDRIIKDELAGAKISEPVFVANVFHTSKRGAEAAQVYWTECLEEPKVGKFYPVGNLPLEAINGQRTFITPAAESFRKSRA